MPVLKPARGATLNPAHPLSRGLVGCWLFNEGIGDGIFNHAIQTPDYLTVSTGYAWIGGQDGLAADFGTTGQNCYFTVSPTIDLGTTAWSVVFAGKSGSEIDYPEFGFYSDNARFVSMNIANAYNAARGLKTRGTFAGTSDTVLDQFYGSEWYQTWANFGIVADVDRIHGYGNGRLIQTITGKVANDLNVDIDAIGSAYNSGGRPTDSDLGYLFVWKDRVLSASEMRQLHLNPYQMFEQSFPAGIFSVAVAAAADIGYLARKVKQKSQHLLIR